MVLFVADRFCFIALFSHVLCFFFFFHFFFDLFSFFLLLLFFSLLFYVTNYYFFLYHYKTYFCTIPTNAKAVIRTRRYYLSVLASLVTINFVRFCLFFLCVHVHIRVEKYLIFCHVVCNIYLYTCMFFSFLSCLLLFLYIFKRHAFIASHLFFLFFPKN